jgi:glycosyltransferase involved in cell wall biosynthesis
MSYISPSVSIIIATFNRANLILETLESIQKQTFKNFECIIIDDGSSDTTEFVVTEFIKNDIRFSFHKRPNQIKKGHCGSRNYGFELSKGKYVNWFDDDDIMHPQCIEKKIVKAEENNFDFVTCEISRFSDDINRNRPIINDYTEGLILQNYYIGNIGFYSVCSLWKKVFLEKNNFFFEENYKPLEDWYFNICAQLITDNYYIVKEVLVFYRLHSNTISDKLSKYNEKLIYQEFLVRKKVYYLYIEKELCNYDVTLCYLNSVRFLMKGLLIKKDKRATVLYKEYIRIKTKNTFFLKQKIKTSIGFLSYILINKGYSFFK